MSSCKAKNIANILGSIDYIILKFVLKLIVPSWNVWQVYVFFCCFNFFCTW
jgi:hypothetical protein